VNAPPIDTLRQDLHRRLDEALNQQGVIQEVILLRVLNKAIGHFATTEADWRNASPLEYRHWREQVKEVLDGLSFMIDSADRYAKEPTELATTMAQASRQLQTAEQNLHILQTQQTALLADLGQTESAVASLSRDVELLTALKTLAPFLEAFKGRIDAQRLQAFADSELCHHQTRYRQQLESLARQNDEGMQKMEALLRESMILTEEEWASLRQAATQVEAKIHP